jgi:glycosyltransferase involved in cell wall biosynthesis
MAEVSVIIPTRNRRRLLSRTLASVLDQRAVDLEVIVVDDCSTDDTAAALRHWPDRRVRMVRQQQRSGVSSARNRGIAESRGEWVAFLDDDDVWAPDKLLRQLRAAQASSSGWVYGGWAVVTPELSILSIPDLPSPEVACRLLPLRNTIATGASNVLVHQGLLTRAGKFDPDLRHMSDWDMWIRLGQLGMPAAVAEPIVGYVMHPANASTDSDDAPREMMIIERRYRSLRTRPTVDRVAVYKWMAWHHLRAGRKGKAVQAYARAVACGDVRSIGRAMLGLVRPCADPQPLPDQHDERWTHAAEWLGALGTSDRMVERARA